MSAHSSMRVFVVVWLGQLLSLVGSGLTGFALGIWVYQQSGSVSELALIFLTTTLPAILVGPLAGALTDRWDRRLTMMLSDSGAGLSTAAVALLLATGNLETWHIYLATAVSSFFSAFQWPAYMASISLLVPKQHLGRANGMTQLGEAVSELIAPVLGAALLVSMGLHDIILIDLVTFLLALITLLGVSFPQPKKKVTRETNISLWDELKVGFRYLTTRPGLLGMMVFFATTNFLLGVVEVLAVPLVLSFASTSLLGTILSVGGLGMVAGSVVMSVWGGPPQRIETAFCFMLLVGVSIIACGLRPSVLVWSIAPFLLFFSLPIIDGSVQVVLQEKVAPEVQGRVFALDRAISSAFLPLAYLVAGPLADYIFEPLMAEGGPLAESIGPLIGTGPGRGIALLFIVMGSLTILVSVVAYHYPRLRLVEDELPDVI
ncbi:MAG: MFS transporter [Ardenticatenaceae bacterium]